MTRPRRTSQWIRVFHSADRPAARIVLFAYAGGSAHIFQSWAQFSAPDIDLWAIELPGRGDRFGERPFQRMGPLIEALAPALGSALDAPYAIFGHSMGAAIGFELAREFERRGFRNPERLFLSGRRAPHLPSRRPPAHLLSDRDFRNELRRLGGTPPDLIDHDELMELVLPCLRADFELSETYMRSADSSCATPIEVFGGAADPDTNLEELEGWSLHTRQFGGATLFPGDHFFLTQQTGALMRLMQCRFRETDMHG